MRKFLVLAALLLAGVAHALSLDQLTDKDTVGGLKEALTHGAGKAGAFGLIEEKDARFDQYVTEKALDGLYLMIAKEEKAIRANPVDAVGKLAKKVFGTPGQ